MTQSKYTEIYNEIKNKIISHEFENGDYLPSENQLTLEYDCSRNTIRRALNYLMQEGFVQPHHGKGVRVIYKEHKKHDLTRNGISGFKQTAIENGYTPHTEVILFTDLVIDKRLAEKTLYDEGTEVYFIQRIRYLDDIPKSMDTNLLRTDLIPGLTKELAAGSIFQYIEDVLGMKIGMIKRSITIGHLSELDRKYMKTENYDCLAIITSRTFNLDGEMFEYTESRTNPDYFQFNTGAWR